MTRRILPAILLVAIWPMWAAGQGGAPRPIVVPILTPPVSSLPLLGPPPGWELKEFTGKAEVAARQEGERFVLHLVSRNTSFALYRDISVNLTQYPVLQWSWKVTELPARGDVRQKATDDQAAQLYLIFPRGLIPALQSHLIGYVWDTTAPLGASVSSPQPCPPTCNTKIIVIQSGPEKLGRWVEERRNLLEDYRTLFGQDPPQLGRIAVMIDSNDTRSRAESFFQELSFFPAAAPRNP